MIFKPALARAVAEGRKTQTRRPIKHGKPCRYKPGHDYAVQPGRGKQAIARLHVISTHNEQVGDITHPAAKAEGFRNTAAFKAYWVQLYDHKWIHNQEHITHPDGIVEVLDPLDESQLARRFDKKHAATSVHVITFELVHDTPRYLAKPGPHQGDYTEQRHRAIDDLEVVDEATANRYAKDALAFCLGRQLERAKKAARDKADRGRSMRLPPHERTNRRAA